MWLLLSLTLSVFSLDVISGDPVDYLDILEMSASTLVGDDLTIEETANGFGFTGDVTGFDTLPLPIPEEAWPILLDLHQNPTQKRLVIDSIAEKEREDKLVAVRFVSLVPLIGEEDGSYYLSELNGLFVLEGGEEVVVKILSGEEPGVRLFQNIDEASTGGGCGDELS